MSGIGWQFAGLTPFAAQTINTPTPAPWKKTTDLAGQPSNSPQANMQPASSARAAGTHHVGPTGGAETGTQAVNAAGASERKNHAIKNQILPAFGAVASGVQLPKGAEKVSSAPGFGGYAPSVFKTGMDYFAKYKHRLNETAVRNLTDNDQVFVGLLYARAEEKMGPSGDPEVNQDLRKVDKIAYQLVIHNMSHDISEELKEQEEARKARAASDEQLSEADPANRYRSPEKRARVEALAKARQERETERQNAHLSAPNPPRSDGLQQKTRDIPQDQANPDQREK